MQTNTLKFAALAALLISLTLGACKKDAATEREVITNIVLHLKAQDGTFEQDFEWLDPDGDGGVGPTADNILLDAGKVYDCTVKVYDRSQTPEVDVTAEIQAENTEHLLVYTPVGVNVTVTPADTDDNGKPFRLKTVWEAGAVSVGSMTVILKHEPDKNAADPDVTGETDFEVSFPVRIK